MSEAVYDEKIAPLLAQVGELCAKHDLPFLAVVEYASGDFGQTHYQTREQSLPMTWANMAARSRGNLDSLVIGILRDCDARGMDTRASMVANRMTGEKP